MVGVVLLIWMGRVGGYAVDLQGRGSHSGCLDSGESTSGRQCTAEVGASRLAGQRR